MHADTREKGMVRCEKRISTSTEEEAAAGTRKGGEGRAARTGLASVLKCLKYARTEQVRIKSASGRARSKARYMRPGGPQTWASRPGGAEARRMGVARSRSHRAGGRPSTRTRTLLPHAVRVAVAAEARGGTAPGSTHLFLGVTRLTPWSSNRCGRRALPAA